MKYESTRKAIRKYSKKMKSITVNFSPREHELYDFIASHEPMSTYLKRLAKKDKEFCEKHLTDL